jgi:hypothetical protein
MRQFVTTSAELVGRLLDFLLHKLLRLSEDDINKVRGELAVGRAPDSS